MKKLIVALFILGVAAPAAWGLYSTRAPAPEAKRPTATPAVSVPEALPWAAPLDRFNDWAISLKRRINAYIRRDQTAATEGWAQQCLPRIGEGLYASARRLHGDGITAVAGKIYNVSGRDRAPAAYMLKLYDGSGKQIGAQEKRLGAIGAHTALSFRAVLRVPGSRVAGVKLELDPATAHH